MTTANLTDLLETLRIDLQMSPSDLSDEHHRWPIYQRALQEGRHLKRVKAAVPLEPVPSLAVSLVLHALESVDEEEHEDWISLLAEDNRAYSRNRSAEIGVVRQVSSGLPDSTAFNEIVDDWSDWVQRRVAAEATDPRVIRSLADRGRTRRVRSTARTRLG